MPYFYESVQVLTEVVDHRGKDALDMMEWTFTGLAYLIKYLSRYLVHEFTKVFDTLAAFLHRQKSDSSYIARFAGESLSYLMRKLPDAQIESAVEYMINDVTQQTHDDPTVYAEGVSTMLIEAICNVQETVHSKGYLIITAMLQTNAPFGSSASTILEAVIIAVVYRCSSTAIKNLVSHLVDSADLKPQSRLLCLSIIATVEMGAKIDDWKVLTSAAIRLHRDCIGYYNPLIQVAAAVILYGDRTQSEQMVSYVFSIPLHEALLYQLALVEVVATENATCYKERVATSFLRYVMALLYLTNLFRLAPAFWQEDNSRTSHTLAYLHFLPTRPLYTTTNSPVILPDCSHIARMIDKVIDCVLTDDEPTSNNMAELVTYLSICNHIEVTASQSRDGTTLNKMFGDLLRHLNRIPHSKYVPFAIGATLQLIGTLPESHDFDCELGEHIHQLWVLQGLVAISQRSPFAFVA